jgi:uncharacterized protein
LSRPDFTASFLRGMAHFNARQFWDAHEAWEELWLVAESDLEQYLQGLIQLAAAYHHVKRGTFRGAVRLFAAAERRLAPFPDPYCGVARAQALAAAREHARWAARLLERGVHDQRLADEDFPKLQLSRSESDVVPPQNSW